MNEKYIRKNKKSYSIVKGSRTYARIIQHEDAIFIRDFLLAIEWDLKRVPKFIENNGEYLVLNVLDEKLYLLAKYKQKPSEETIQKMVKRHNRNPNNSKYGLNISKMMETFIISKQIAGDSYVFGLYDNLEDAEFVRNFLMDHDWNVNEFENVQYDEESNSYKVTLVIDDNVYVLGSFSSDNIDLNREYEKFLSKVSKHKYGLANHPHLDRLKNRIPELEEMLNVKASDENWTFKQEISEHDALSEIIFTLTPFQKSVYDAIDNASTIDDIKKKLIRYKSGNFENKIKRNLDELIERDLIKKEGDYYIKT